jgi:ferredoxin
MHCSEPCCASVCFVEAFTKTPEGPVLYDPDVCVGCRYCVFACPYYALTYEYDDPLTPRVTRCTMCYPRIVQGQAPACADACPTGAIQYGRRSDLLDVARERIRRFPDRYRPEIFGEAEFAGTSWLTLAGVPFRELGFPDEPQNVTRTPLPDFTTGFLSLAPLVAAIFPGMLGGFYAFAKRKDTMHKAAVAEAVARERVTAAEALEARLREAAEAAAREKDYAVEMAIRETLRRGEEARAAASAPSAPAPSKGEKEGAK